MSGRWIDAGLLFAGTGHFFPKNLIDNRTVEGFSANAVEDKLLGDLGVRTRHRSDDTETIQYISGPNALERHCSKSVSASHTTCSRPSSRWGITNWCSTSSSTRSRPILMRNH